MYYSGYEPVKIKVFNSVNKYEKLILSAVSGTSGASTSSVVVTNQPSVTVLNPSVTVLNPSVTITGTTIATQSLQTISINTLAIIKTLLDSVKYYSNKSAYGSNNDLGGYFYASTLTANTTTVLTQFGASIPSGYKLCITSINISSNNVLSSITSFSLNSGNTSNTKFMFSQIRATAASSSNEISKTFDSKVPLMLNPNESLFIASSPTGVVSYNLVVIGYISKL